MYQADWLLRFYGFEASELVTEADQNLSLDVDPKLAWALANRHRFPIDVNSAGREQLLRIPGIGARSVKRLLKIRRYKHIQTCDLKKLKVAWNRAKYFALTSDHNPALRKLDMLDLVQKTRPATQQLMLFDAMQSATSGEV